MFFKRFCILLAALNLLTSPHLHAQERSDETQEQSDEAQEQANELIRQELAELYEKVRNSAPEVVSATAKKLGNYPYQETNDILYDLIKEQLNREKPNSYIITPALESLREFGNNDSKNQLETLDFRTKIQGLADGVQARLNSLYNDCIDQMESRTSKLPFIPKSKDTSYKQWMAEESFKDKDMARVVSVTARILNDDVIKIEHQNSKKPEESFSVFGRTEEANALVDNLSRIKSKNPILLGPSGVGKTAIAFKLAEMIEHNKIPQSHIFDDVRSSIILEVSPSGISALALSDANFAQAAALTNFFNSVLNVQKKYGKKFIIFMDEIHTLNSGQREALKPLLENINLDLRLIGATTFPEYEQAFKDNEPLQRRFSQISVKELTKEQVIRVLKTAWQPIIEKKYGVHFEEGAIETLTEKTIQMKEAGGPIGASIRVMQDLSIQANRRESKKESLTIKEKDIFVFFENLLQYPANPRDGKSFQKYLKKWNEELKQNVIGQEKVIENVSRHLRLLFQDNEKRVSPLLLLGPTGVGKTSLANAVAKVVFQNPRAILEIDATSFKTGGFSLNSMFGAPPGVISSDKTSGRLMEWLGDPAQGKKGGVLVINEIERASKDLWEKLMEFFDKGIITGADGKDRAANNLLIILTSNKGHETLYPEGISSWSNKEIQDHLSNFSQKDLRNLFPDLDPAVLNRLNEIILMNPINKEVAKLIANNTATNWARKHEKLYSIEINVAKDFGDRIIDFNFDISDGVRPIIRKIEHSLNLGISDIFSKWDIGKNDKIEIAFQKADNKDNKLYIETFYKNESLVSETDFSAPLHPLDDVELARKINNLGELNNKIIGQPDLVESIKESVLSHYSNNRKKRPLSIALIGLTGIGKTETGKALSKAWYGHDRSEVISLGHIQYTGEMNNIFNSPKGHVGSNEEGIFERALRNNPKGGVIIFDEFSNMGALDKNLKTTLYKMFYNMLDEGKWESIVSNKTYDLSNYIFLFTGNDGEKAFEGVPTEIKEILWDRLKDREKVNEILKSSGVPDAFLGRLSNSILLKPLNKEDLIKISGKFLSPIVQDLESRDIELVIDDEFKKFIADNFFLPQSGARGIRNFIQNILIGKINKPLLEHQGERVSQIHLKISDNVSYDSEDIQDRKIILSIEGLSNNAKKSIFKESLDVTLHAEKKITLNKDFLRSVAIHEAGHALIHQRLYNDSQIDFININPGKQSLGYVYYSRKDKPLNLADATRQGIVFRVARLLGGRLAEVRNGYDLNSGWSSDMQQANKIIKNFTKSYKSDSLTSKNKAQRNLLIQEDETKIFEDAKKLTNTILTEHEETLEKLANLLLEKKVLTGEEFREFMKKELKSTKGEDTLTDRLINKMAFLDKIASHIWLNDDNLSSRLIKENFSSKESVKNLDTETIKAIIQLAQNKNNKKTLLAIAENILSVEFSKDYSNLLELAIKIGDPDVIKYIEENVLTKNHWKTHHRLLELCKGEKVNMKDLKEALKVNKNKNTKTCS